jgi:hypothetical protein
LPRLARDASELRGRRAARWVRESTPGQLDRWGPPSQRRMQDTALEELGLIDTGLAWTVGRSGWSGPDSMDDPPATRTPEFRAMLAAAEAGAFDVLLVGLERDLWPVLGAVEESGSERVRAFHATRTLRVVALAGIRQRVLGQLQGSR